jgi:parallel beta-helix repeat protein
MKSLPVIQIIILLILNLCFQSSSILASDNNQTLYVGGSGAGNFTKIQNAVDNATENSSIYVYNGTYYETIIISIPVILQGENATTTILDGHMKDSVIRLQSDNVTITNFTIQHGKNQYPEASIAIHTHHNTICHNILQQSYYGIVLLNASYNSIKSNFIANNNQCGIYFSSASHNHLVSNTVDTQPFNGFGIYDFSNHNLIQNNTLLRNQLYAINIRDSYNNQIIGNTMINNTLGLHLPEPQFHTMVTTNTFLKNGISIDEQPSLIYTVLPESLMLLFLALIIFRKIILRP